MKWKSPSHLLIGMEGSREEGDSPDMGRVS